MQDWSLADISGIAGFLLSLFILFRDCLRNRISFSVDVIDYADFGGSTRFYLLITNHSHRPLTITKVIYDEVLCELDPKKIRNRPEDWNFQHSVQFPVCIAALDARMVYLEFVASPHTQLSPGKAVSFQIQTISRSVLKTLILASRLCYLNTNRSPQ